MNLAAERMDAERAAELDAFGAAEDWLIAGCEKRVGSRFRSIDSGPGQWSEAYLEREIAHAPAIRVAFLDATARTENDLVLDTRWAIFILAGWSGAGQQGRRRGTSRSIGAFRAARLLAPAFHNCPIPDVGLVRVRQIVNIWTGDADEAGLAIFTLGLDIEMPLDPVIDEAEFADFLSIGVDWNLPRVGEDVDASDRITVPRPRPAGEGPAAFSRGSSAGFR